MDLVGADGAAVAALAETAHLGRAGFADLGRGLLVWMDAEATQEPRQSDDAGAGRAEAEQQVPVEREAKRLVDGRAGALPDAPPPEERLLGHVVGPGEDL